MNSHRKGTNRYNKVNQQKKFYLLTLIYKQHIPVRQAAQIVGINYLTAKTIVFFYKNNHKTYQFNLEKTNPLSNAAQYSTASVVSLKKINSIQEKLNKPKSRIQVICSIGNILSPPATTNDRKGPPQEQQAKSSALELTLPTHTVIPSPDKSIETWPYFLYFSGKSQADASDGKFGLGEVEADRTRVFQ